MQITLVILGYLKWHYSKAISSLGKIWKNFLYFVFDFFSIGLLFKNFFDPWKRMTDNYPKSFDFKIYFAVFITNLITRIIGIIVRLVLIIIGLACYILLTLLFPVALAIWLVLPFIIILLIIEGVFLII